MAAHNELGKWGEDVAAHYLSTNGYIIRDRDWQHNHCDLDIVAIEIATNTLVFVEVKTRSCEKCGDPAEAITLNKIDNVMKTAYYYQRFYYLQHMQVRYDTIFIVGTNLDTMKLDHQKNVMSVLDRYHYSLQKKKSKKYNRPGTWPRSSW